MLAAATVGAARTLKSVDDPHRRFGVVTFADADSLAESVDDVLPGSVSATAHVVAVHGVPMRVARR